MTNTEIIEERLNSVDPKNKWEEKAVEFWKQFYLKDHAEEVKELPKSKVVGFLARFVVISKAIEFEKQDIIRNKTVKLERHAYAPEMNCLHFENGSKYSTPQMKDIESAVKYVAKCISGMELEQCVGETA